MDGIALPAEAAARTEHRCHLCGSDLTPGQADGEAPSSPIQTEWPVGLDPLALPTHVAIPFEHYLVESNPRVRLHWLVDTAEICVRWVAAVTVAEVAADNDGRLPDAVAHRIAHLIERPTLGAWVRMLRTVIANAPSKPKVAPGYFRLLHSVFAGRFRPSQDPEGREGETPSLLALRNHLVHCGGLSSAAASRCLLVHRPGFEEMVRVIADAGDGLGVYAADGGRRAWLRGPSPIDAPPPPILAQAGDGTWLVSRDQSATISLSPLVTYRPVLSIDGGWRRSLTRDDDPDDARGPVPQVYFRFEDERLSYTPLGVDAGISVELNTRPFRELFRLGDVSKNASPEQSGWDRFLLEARVKQDGLIGRRKELDRVKTWVKRACGSDPTQSGRIGWLHGAPGLGKSLLMAKLAHDAANGRKASRQIYFHAFRANDPDNTRWALLRGLRGALRAWRAFRDFPLAPADDLEGAELEADVRFLLGAIPEIAQERSDTPRLVVYLDGLDEVIKGDPELPRMIHDLALPGTTWVIAGRAEPALMRAFATPGCETIFPDGLPPMQDADVRAMLMDGLADAGHRLAAIDRDPIDAAPDQPVSNPFVQAVVRRARGAPIYVRLLLEDLRAGRRRIEEAPERLPDTLADYYRSILTGQGVAFDVNAHLGLVLSILAAADEPLDRDALAGLLRLRPTLGDGGRARAWIDAACDLGRMLLTTAPMPFGDQGLTLYHLSLKEWLIGDPELHQAPAAEMEASLDQARWLLADAARQAPRLTNGSLRRHALRRGCAYLLRWAGEAGVAQALARATDSTAVTQMRQAWGCDGAGFFLSLHDLDRSLSARTTDSHTDEVALALLDHWLGLKEPSAELETAHAVLNYRPDKTLYRALLELADDASTSPRFQTPEHFWLQALLRARHANLLRKAGDLDAALALLTRNRAAFRTLPPSPARDQELARLEYDAGYVSYLKGRFPEADRHLADSIHYAAMAGDQVGEWISRCVRARFAALGQLNDGADAFAGAMAAFHQVLVEALDHFEHAWRRSGNQHALRWIMNVHAHRFEVAFARDDLPAARDALEALRGTLWVRRFAPETFSDRYEARLHLLEGRFSQAAAVFERFLAANPEPDDPCLHLEEISSHYYQYGRALLGAGEKDRAIQAWQSALLAPAGLGNSHWRERLKASIAAAST
jgi:tetratricopeptide (TPR) repeat protein